MQLRAVPALSESQQQFAGLKPTFPAVQLARICKSEFKPAVQKAGEANPGNIFPLEKKKKIKKSSWAADL